MGSKAATAGPQLTCVVFCLAVLSNISPAEAPHLLWQRISPEEINSQFQLHLHDNIHAAVPAAYRASLQETSPDAVVTRHAFLTSVAGKTTTRLKELHLAPDNAGQLIPYYWISVFIWDMWAEDAEGVVTEGQLAGRVAATQLSFKDSTVLAPTGRTWDWAGSGGGSLHETVDLVGAAGSSSEPQLVGKLEVMVYMSRVGERLFPQVERNLWARGSRDALDASSELPIYMVDITDLTYNAWVAGITAAYNAEAASSSIRGLHACLAEGCGYHAEARVFMHAHEHTRPVDDDINEANPEIIMALLPNDPRRLTRPVASGK